MAHHTDTTATQTSPTAVEPVRRDLVVPASRCGPPGTANGGWISGLLATELGSGDGAQVQVDLRRPTPLDVPLDVRLADGVATLHEGPDPTAPLVATAALSSRILEVPSAVAPDEVTAAESRFAGVTDHPFPGCFVCGTERDPADGLCIFPGAVAGRPGTVAGWWRPHPSLAEESGAVTVPTVWAALDCPSGWAHHGSGGVALLASLTAEIHAPVLAGEAHVVVAERVGRDGRKLHSRSAVFAADGRALAVAEALWIEVPADTTVTG